MIRHSLLLYLITFSLSIQGQVEGAWVRIQETDYEQNTQPNLQIVSKDYLKLNFQKDYLKIYASHMANGFRVPYQIQDNVLSFGAGRHFHMEEQSDTLLILVDLYDGKVTRQSKRHYYQKESVFLDRLPYPSDDLVILGKDTAFIASRKLYPVFKTTNTPDFHIFIHNQIRNTYSIGENYFHGSFMIRPDGSIDHVQINHHLGKTSDKRAIKAILSSAGRWDMPLLNGKKVNILMTIEDLFTKKANSPVQKPLNLTSNYNNEAPEVYMGFFNLAIRNMLVDQSQKALEYLQLCEDRKPKDPNIPYLRYLIYKNLHDQNAAEAALALVKKSRLRYLVKHP